MIKNLIKIALIAIVAIIGYNYFFGDAEEKEQSKAIISKTKELGASAFNLIKDEINKAKEGKYDGAIDKVKETLGKLTPEQKAENKQAIENIEKEINTAEKKIQEWEKEDRAPTTEDKETVEDQLQKMLKELETILNKEQ